MHEFKTIEEIYNTLIRMDTIPERVYIKLGKLKGNSEFVKFALESMLKNTPFEKMRMEFIEVKPSIRCVRCGFSGEIEVPDHVDFVRCPFCNSVADVVEGNTVEILVKE